MARYALLARFEAKPGREDEVAAFLKSALPMVEAEPGTGAWYGWQISPATFGVFDVFDDEAGRDAHLNGAVAAALMAKAPDLFVGAPTIEKLDLLAVKPA